MTKPPKIVFAVAGLVTAATLITWQMTGGDSYTKYQVVEEIERKLDADDPLAGTGMYEDDIVKETVTRDEFRLGLIPTPNAFLDKNTISVATVLAPVWAFTIVFWWFMRRRE